MRPIISAFAAWVILSAYFCFVAFAKAQDVPLDPTGVYVSHCGERLAYRVFVTKIKGAYCTSWFSLNSTAPSYLGRLDLQPDGSWKETYAKDENLSYCAPWRWIVASQNPIAFRDEIEDGYTITVPPPDF